MRGTWHGAAPPAGHTRTQGRSPSAQTQGTAGPAAGLKPARREQAHEGAGPGPWAPGRTVQDVPAPSRHTRAGLGSRGASSWQSGAQTGGVHPHFNGRQPGGGALLPVSPCDPAVWEGTVETPRGLPPGARSEGPLHNSCFFKTQALKSPLFSQSHREAPVGTATLRGSPNPTPCLGPQRPGAAWVGPRRARLKLGTRIPAQKLRINNKTEAAFPRADAAPGRGEGPPAAGAFLSLLQSVFLKKQTTQKNGCEVLATEERKNLRETVPACQSRAWPNIGRAPGPGTCRGDSAHGALGPPRPSEHRAEQRSQTLTCHPHPALRARHTRGHG